VKRLSIQQLSLDVHVTLKEVLESLVSMISLEDVMIEIGDWCSNTNLDEFKLAFPVLKSATFKGDHGMKIRNLMKLFSPFSLRECSVVLEEASGKRFQESIDELLETFKNLTHLHLILKNDEYLVQATERGFDRHFAWALKIVRRCALKHLVLDFQNSTRIDLSPFLSILR
jgi:hypothetical protein